MLKPRPPFRPPRLALGASSSWTTSSVVSVRVHLAPSRLHRVLRDPWRAGRPTAARRLPFSFPRPRPVPAPPSQLGPPGGGAWLCGALHAAHGLRSQGQWVVSALFLKTGWKHHGRKPSAAPRPPPRAPSEGFRGWEAQSLLGGPPAHLQAAPELRAQGGGRPADSGSGTRGP